MRPAAAKPSVKCSLRAPDQQKRSQSGKRSPDWERRSTRGIGVRAHPMPPGAASEDRQSRHVLKTLYAATHSSRRLRSTPSPRRYFRTIFWRTQRPSIFSYVFSNKSARAVVALQSNRCRGSCRLDEAATRLREIEVGRTVHVLPPCSNSLAQRLRNVARRHYRNKPARENRCERVGRLQRAGSFVHRRVDFAARLRLGGRQPPVARPHGRPRRPRTVCGAPSPTPPRHRLRRNGRPNVKACWHDVLTLRAKVCIKRIFLTAPHEPDGSQEAAASFRLQSARLAPLHPCADLLARAERFACAADEGRSIDVTLFFGAAGIGYEPLRHLRPGCIPPLPP